MDEVDARGRRVRDDSFVVLFNAHHDAIEFTVPAALGTSFAVMVDTARGDLPPGERVHPGGEPYPLEGRSLAVLRRVAPP
jgi:glycogen operon protein